MKLLNRDEIENLVRLETLYLLINRINKEKFIVKIINKNPPMFKIIKHITPISEYYYNYIDVFRLESSDELYELDENDLENLMAEII